MKISTITVKMNYPQSRALVFLHRGDICRMYRVAPERAQLLLDIYNQRILKDYGPHDDCPEIDDE